MMLQPLETLVGDKLSRASAAVSLDSNVKISQITPPTAKIWQESGSRYTHEVLRGLGYSKEI